MYEINFSGRLIKSKFKDKDDSAFTRLAIARHYERPQEEIDSCLIDLANEYEDKEYKIIVPDNSFMINKIPNEDKYIIRIMFNNEEEIYEASEYMFKKLKEFNDDCFAKTVSLANNINKF